MYERMFACRADGCAGSGLDSPSSMASVPDTQGESLSAKVLVLGEPGALGEALVRRLSAAGVAAQLTNPPTDADVKAVLEQDGWTAAAIITRDDALALRLTLLCEHVHPELPLWATVFDRTIVHQLRAAVPAVRLLSPSEMARQRASKPIETQKEHQAPKPTQKKRRKVCAPTNPQDTRANRKIPRQAHRQII